MPTPKRFSPPPVASAETCPIEKAQSAPPEFDFDVSEYRSGEEHFLLDDVIAKYNGSKHMGAYTFVKMFGEGGRKIADAEDEHSVNFMIGAALHPKNITGLITINSAQGSSFRKLPLRYYGKGMTAQLIEFLQKNPDLAKPVGINFREAFLKLDEMDDKERLKNISPVDIKRGILEKLAKTSASHDAQFRIPAQYLTRCIQPQIDFRKSILNKSLNRDVATQIVGMEILLTENKLRIGTSASFQTLAYEFLARALEFQAQNPKYPVTRKLHRELEQTQGSNLGGNKLDNLGPTTRLINELQDMPQYGLTGFSLSPLKTDNPHSFPLAIDRLMYIATVLPEGVEAAVPDVRLTIVRSLGHSARMFAEQAVSKSSAASEKLSLADIQIRYPGLDNARHKALFRLVKCDHTSREIHAQARKKTD